MDALTHYVVVRRDLPFGVLVSMIAHAAGESFYAFALPKVTFSNWTMASGACMSGPFSASGEIQTFTIPAGPPFDASQTIAVVLGARNEGRLQKLERELQAAGVQHVVIRETDGDYAGQVMAIGLIPGPKATLYPHVREFHMYREFGV